MTDPDLPIAHDLTHSLRGNRARYLRACRRALEMTLKTLEVKVKGRVSSQRFQAMAQGVIRWLLLEALRELNDEELERFLETGDREVWRWAIRRRMERLR